MKLYKVTIECKELDWDRPMKLHWAIMGETPEQAIQNIKNEFDMTDVIIINEYAIEIKYAVLNSF